MSSTGRRDVRVLGGLTLACALAGCSRSVDPPPSAATKDPAAKALEPGGEGEVDARFVDDVKGAFASYKAWGRVDDQLRWAPWLCKMPQPGRPEMSAALAGGHARKLYSLFAKDHDAYTKLFGDDAPKPQIGQVVAKESYRPEVVSEVANNARPSSGLGDPATTDHFDPYVREGDTLYHAAELVGVYVMLRKQPSTAGTDDGWVYGTVTSNGVVTSAGRVTSCMGCHADAKHGRLFGRDRR